MIQFNDLFLYDFRANAGGIWLLVAGMFILGAAFGSFFNVVAYRLPRRMSLLHPPSTCPSCQRAIRWHDNVPIFGWLLLGGRCRDCRSAISPRYPLVELFVAATTALVTWSAAASLPGPDEGQWFTLKPMLVVFQVLLVYTLFCAALLEFDGNRLGPRTLAAMLVIGAVVPVIWPGLRPMLSSRAIYDSGAFLAAALVLGALAWPMLVEKTDSVALRAAAARVAELALVGLFLGLAAVAAIAVFASACFLATSVASRCRPAAGRFGWAAWLLVGTLIWIAAGERLVARWPSLGAQDAVQALAVAGALVAALAVAGRAAQSFVRPIP